MDVPALSELACACFTETFGHLYPPQDLEAFLHESYAPAVLANEVEDADYFWRVVYEDERMIAYLMCAPVGLPHRDADPASEGELKRLYVRQSHQGRGLGKILMDMALEHLSARYSGAAQWIGVWSENHRAQMLYQAYGFEKVGDYEFRVGETMDAEFILRKSA
jgi:ribosomal protein S18 acetylase RimI-like enzyme